MAEEPSTQFSGDASFDDGDTVMPEETSTMVKFENLNLSGQLLDNVYAKMGFHKPTKLQSLCLPMIPNDNVFAEAYSASGKTTCIVMGSLSCVDPQLRVPQVLCLTPTQELAKQICGLFLKMGSTDISAKLIFPNEFVHVPMTDQVIIGTAATVYYLIENKKLDTSCLVMVMFDDADHMLSEGGSEEGSVRIMKDIYEENPECKVLLYATIFNDAVKSFVREIGDALNIEECAPLFVKKDGPALVKQYKVNVPYELSKIDFIKKLLDLVNYTKTIIFVHTEESAEMLHRVLVNDADSRLNVTNLHAARTQTYKDSILTEYKDGLTQHLITNDVHARGFDLAEVNLVINYDLPLASELTEDDCELYSHRIGRVGRRHNKGVVFNFLCGDADNNLMEKIANYNNENNIEEVPFEIGDEEFEDILKKAGL